MGVKNLWDILESCKKTLPLHHLQNKRFCIDLSCWIVQLQNVSKSYACMKEKTYLKGLFHRIRALIALNCSLIFVADGSIPGIKLSTYRRRLNLGNEVIKNGACSQELSSLQRNKGSEFSLMIKEAKALGLVLGIPCLDGLEEAEAQCALLNSESLCDGCFTSDSDIFLFGARTVYRDICLDGGYVVCYEAADIERKLGFGRNSMITFALLLGSDYSEGVYGLGRESACQIVKEVGDNAVLQKISTEGLSFLKKGKISKKQVVREEQVLHKCDQFSHVIDAYLKPKCHSVDSNAVTRVLTQYPFEHSKLQRICAQFFAWPPEKTDEYILPKIAERDLRRYANLRSSTYELGFNIPMVKVPVNCPVSGIIKQRKVQGSECFEVSWRDLNGLHSSIVPADLLQRACPEMIVEFEEQMAQRKKQNKHKPKKRSEMVSSVAEIDEKLQALLLEIESNSTTVNNLHHAPRASDKSSTDTSVDVVSQEFLPNMEWGDIDRTHGSEKIEVINLVSPSPAMQTRKVSKFQQGNSQEIHVIDLSDTENDQSPEHERKARELRSFLISLRD